MKPEKTLEFVKKVSICKFCGKPLTEKEVFICDECCEKQKEKIQKNIQNIGWVELFGLMVVAGLDNNNDNNDNKKEN